MESLIFFEFINFFSKYFENACISSLEKNINNNQIFDKNSQLAWRNFIKFILDRYLDGLLIEEC
jgi:hypothetical protein